MNPKTLKIIGLIATLLVIANILLFAFGIINAIVFWVVIVVAAVFVYVVLPKLKK